MILKDLIFEDADIFVNLDEFGEMAEIDGVKIRAVIQKNTGEKKNTNIASKHEEYYVHPELHNEPLSGDFITVYFKTFDYVKERGRIPQNLEFCRINGKRYKVLISKDEMGITKLECSADRMPTPKMSKLPGIYE